MNKSIIIAIIIGVAIAIAAGSFVTFEDNTVPIQNMPDTSLDVAEEEIETEPKGRSLTLEFSESMSPAGNP